MTTKRRHHKHHGSHHKTGTGTYCSKKCDEVYKLDRAIRKIDEAMKELRKARGLVADVRDEILR